MGSVFRVLYFFHNPSFTRQRSRRTRRHFTRSTTTRLKNTLTTFSRSSQCLLRFRPRPPHQMFRLSLGTMSLRPCNIRIRHLRHVTQMTSRSHHHITRKRTHRSTRMRQDRMKRRRAQRQPISSICTLRVTQTSRRIITLNNNFMRPRRVIKVIQRITIRFTGMIRSIIRSPTRPHRVNHSRPLFTTTLRRIGHFKRLFPTLPSSFDHPIKQAIISSRRFREFKRQGSLISRHQSIFLLIMNQGSCRFTRETLFSSFLCGNDVVLRGHTTPTLFLQKQQVFPTLYTKTTRTFCQQHFVTQVSYFTTSLAQ